MPTALVVPTYQEAGNIERFLKEAHNALPDATIVIFDDSSPDGTGEIAERVGRDLGNVEVVHRPAKEGLGAAYRHAFTYALEGGFDVVISMDCDFSHDPHVLPELEAAVRGGADVAIGSRYVPGGSTPDWPLRRRMLSRYGNEYARTALRLAMHDATAGFRAYSADALRGIRHETTRSNNYGFMIETGYRLTLDHARVAEIPIVFHDRTEGESKMAVPTMVETMLSVTWWGLCLRAPKLTDRFRATSLGRRLYSVTGPAAAAPFDAN
jgi:dolichol-phosphate mannosyltransferase